jgi:hypothetical protein
MGFGDAECLQVAEVACAALVPGHDGVYLQGPLVRDLPSNSPPRSIRSGPWRIGEPHPLALEPSRRTSEPGITPWITAEIPAGAYRSEEQPWCSWRAF